MAAVQPELWLRAMMTTNHQHVSGDDLAHLQENLTVFTACGIMHPILYVASR
jgi:hypothetical protein